MLGTGPGPYHFHLHVECGPRSVEYPGMFDISIFAIEDHVDNFHGIFISVHSKLENILDRFVQHVILSLGKV